MDKGYDNKRVLDETRERGVVAIVCLRKGRPDSANADPPRLGRVEAPLPWPLRRRAGVRELKNEYGA